MNISFTEINIEEYAQDISNQIKCVEKEILKRINFYPTWVARGKMTQKTADMEIATMKAVLKSLQTFKRKRLNYTFNQH